MRQSALESRERLLQAALRTFGAFGFDGTSTRLLAQEANVNISAIAYYFGDKQGLYAACLDHIATTIRESFMSRFPEIRGVTSWEKKSEDECRQALHAVLKHIVHFLLGDTISLAMAQIFLREQMNPSPSFGVLYDQTLGQMHELLTKLLARLTGLPFPSERATLCAHTVMGQVIAFKTHREAALRRLQWKKFGPAEVKKIEATVLAHTEFVIAGYRSSKGARA